MRPLPLLLSALALLPLTAGSASASLPAIGRAPARSASADEADRASPAAAPVASPAAGLQLGGTALNSGNRIVNATAWRAYATGAYATGNSTGTVIQGNTIRSNSGNGVMLVGATRITVGGVATGAGNVIAFNGGYGITAGGTCTGSLIQGNAITGNAFGTVNVRNAMGIRVV
jgi:hypothetical protein